MFHLTISFKMDSLTRCDNLQKISHQEPPTVEEMRLVISLPIEVPNHFLSQKMPRSTSRSIYALFAIRHVELVMWDKNMVKKLPLKD